MKIHRFFMMAFVLCWLSTPVLADSGTPAPTFVLETDKGQVKLADFRGRVVYLDFWAAWCAPCQDAFPWMNEMQKRYADQGLVIIAINLDPDRKLAQKFLTTYPPQFTVAYDPAGKTALAYELKGMPSSYLIDRDGNLRLKHTGFREKDKATLEMAIREVLTRGAKKTW